MWIAYNYYLLGIRPEFDGLVIDPKMPADWKGFSVERPFRGDHFKIVVEKSKELPPGELRIKVDGILLEENLIKPFKDGKNHLVVVEAGPAF